MPQIKVYNSAKDFALPKYETSGAAGMDVYAVEEVVIYPNSVVAVPTGLYVEVPQGYEIQVRPRSGLSFKTPLRVANAPGTIDSDYRGEIKVLLWNTAQVSLTIRKGDRIGQIVLQEVPIISWKEVQSIQELTNTSRGVGGFGSTGS